ncbi:MAG: UDP-galactopyranose mutase [Clostridiales bacterium]|nr:UDP-galactopyranose mutase [Clostridiales bacterium]
MKYDYLIVGSGLFGCVFAHEAVKRGKKCLVIEKRSHIGGNIYCEKLEDITVHKYGAHIFHTSNEQVWNYVTSLVRFNNFINSPIANYKGEIYNLPFNMNTFSRMWNISEPSQAAKIIAEQRAEITGEPENLEQQAISLVGREIYTKLIKGYTEKQWGRDCTELPAFIIKRLPVRYPYNNNYFNARYQGIPEQGYTALIEKLLEGCDLRLGCDFFDNRGEYSAMADKIVYTGMIDAYFGYKFGKLSYRSLRFENETLDTDNYQGVAVVNYTEREIPYTRVIEHKHFEFGTQPKTVITKEYPVDWSDGMEPYYPINDNQNNALYEKYAALAADEKNVIFGGRLAQYKYYDMDKTVEAALAAVNSEMEKHG